MPSDTSFAFRPTWNGRFLFQGGGGIDGLVNPAVGTMASTGRPVALARGYAVVSTDSGHTGSIVDATFGVDQQARIDYGYNALDKVTAAAKALIRRSLRQGARTIPISSAAPTAAVRR